MFYIGHDDYDSKSKMMTYYGYKCRDEGKSHKKYHQVLRLNCQNCLTGEDYQCWRCLILLIDLEGYVHIDSIAVSPEETDLSVMEGLKVGGIVHMCMGVTWFY